MAKINCVTTPSCYCSILGSPATVSWQFFLEGQRGRRSPSDFIYWPKMAYYIVLVLQDILYKRWHIHQKEKKEQHQGTWTLQRCLQGGEWRRNVIIVSQVGRGDSAGAWQGFRPILVPRCWAGRTRRRHEKVLQWRLQEGDSSLS